MAVQLDLDAVRDAVEPSVFREAEELLDDDLVDEITAAGGGATATVDEVVVWVGVVHGAFTAECDCARSTLSADEELCAHAVALTIAAIEADFVWSPTAVPPSQE